MTVFAFSPANKGERVQVWSRRGADFTYRFLAIAEAVRNLAVDRGLIDGEAVVLRNDGRSDFIALLTKRGGAQASLVAFDLLLLEGDDLRLRPIEARREALQRLVAGVDGILFSEALAAEGAVVFAKTCELGLEGIVSKREGSFYKRFRQDVTSCPATALILSDTRGGRGRPAHRSPPSGHPELASPGSGRAERFCGRNLCDDFQMVPRVFRLCGRLYPHQIFQPCICRVK
jgi:hypothetical protein